MVGASVPTNVAAGKALLHQYRLMKWKAERAGCSLTGRLNSRIEELEDALAGLELEAEDYREDLAESAETRMRLESALDAERAACAVQRALRAAEVQASTSLAEAVCCKANEASFAETERAIERERLIWALGQATLITKRERDAARKAHAEVLAGSQRSERCVSALAAELAAVGRAVEAQTAASSALITSTDCATQRAERAERRADMCDKRLEHSAMVAVSRSLEAQREIVELQTQLGRAYNDLSKLAELRQEALENTNKVSAAHRTAIDQKAELATAWAAIAAAMRDDADRRVAQADNAKDELFERLADLEARCKGDLAERTDKIADLQRQLDFERAASEELLATLDERDEELKGCDDRAVQLAEKSAADQLALRAAIAACEAAIADAKSHNVGADLDAKESRQSFAESDDRRQNPDGDISDALDIDNREATSQSRTRRLRVSLEGEERQRPSLEFELTQTHEHVTEALHGTTKFDNGERQELGSQLVMNRESANEATYHTMNNCQSLKATAMIHEEDLHNLEAQLAKANERVRTAQDKIRELEGELTNARARTETTEDSSLPIELEAAQQQAEEIDGDCQTLPFESTKASDHMNPPVEGQENKLPITLEGAQQRAKAIDADWRSLLNETTEALEHTDQSVDGERPQIHELGEGQELHRANEEVKVANQERIALQSKLDEAQQKIEAVNGERLWLETKLRDAEELGKAADDERTKLQFSLDKVQEEMELAFKQRLGLETRLSEAEDQWRARDERLVELQTKLDEAQQVATASDKRHIHLQNTIEEMQKQGKAAEEERFELQQKLDKAQEVAKSANDQCLALQTELFESKELAKAGAGERVELETELEKAKEVARSATEERLEMQTKLEKVEHLVGKMELEHDEVIATKILHAERVAKMSVDSERRELEAELSEARQRTTQADEARCKLESSLMEVRSEASKADAERTELKAKLAMTEERAAAGAAAFQQHQELEVQLAKAKDAAEEAAKERFLLEIKLADVELETGRLNCMVADLKADKEAAIEQAAASAYRDVEASLQDARTCADNAARTVEAQRLQIESKLFEAEDRQALFAQAIDTVQAERCLLEARLAEVVAAAAIASERQGALAHDLESKLQQALQANDVRESAARRQCEELRAMLTSAEADSERTAKAATDERRQLETRLAEARFSAASAANATVTDWRELETQLEQAMSLVSSVVVAPQKQQTETTDMRNVSEEFWAARATARQLATELDVLGAEQAAAIVAREGALAELQAKLAHAESEAKAAVASRDALKSSSQAELNELRNTILEIEARLAAACAASAMDADQIVTETEMLRSALDTVKAEREALRTDTDLLRQALECVKAENFDLKKVASGTMQVDRLVIAEVDDDDVSVDRERSATPHLHTGSLVPTSPAAIDQLRAMAIACDEKIRVHVEAAADGVAVAFAKEFEKRDQLEQRLSRYREDRDAARFERDAERRRAEAVDQAAEEAVAKAGAERDNALERAEAAEDELALLRAGPCLARSDWLLGALIDTLRGARSTSDLAHLDSLAAELSASCAIATQERSRLQRALANASKERNDTRTAATVAAEAEILAQKLMLAKADMPQAAAECRAALLDSPPVRDDHEAMESLRRELRETTRAKIIADKNAHAHAQRVRDLEQRLERDSARSDRLEAHAADLLSQLAQAERARASLAASKLDLASGAENRLSTLPLKKAAAVENKSLRDQLRTLKMDNLKLRAQRDELMDDLSHVRSELTRTRLVIHGIEHYSHARAVSSTATL